MMFLPAFPMASAPAWGLLAQFLAKVIEIAKTSFEIRGDQDLLKVLLAFT